MSRALVVLLGVSNEHKLIINFIILRGDQEAGCQIDIYFSGTHALNVFHILCSLVQEESVHHLDSDVCCLASLVELLAHGHNLFDEFYSFFSVKFGHFVLWQIQIIESNEVINLVSGFVLEHLGQKLCWRNVSVELQ